MREVPSTLEAAGPLALPAPLPSPWPRLCALAGELRGAALVLLLDYDGTLVPFAETPGLAVPDVPLLDLLAALAARPRTRVHVVSGRAPEVLERWLGDLPIALHAEHGLWSRPAPAVAWHALETPPVTWRQPVQAVLEEFAACTPGALVEEKTLSLAWHYRAADPELGPRRAQALQRRLGEVLSNLPAEILEGEKVIEIRPRGVNKGRISRDLGDRLPAGVRVVALGDDRTDEDLFAALPPGAVALHVGPTASAAPWRLADVAAARRFLRLLLEAPE